MIYELIIIRLIPDTIIFIQLYWTLIRGNPIIHLFLTLIMCGALFELFCGEIKIIQKKSEPILSVSLIVCLNCLIIYLCFHHTLYLALHTLLWGSDVRFSSQTKPHAYTRFTLLSYNMQILLTLQNVTYRCMSTKCFQI